MKKKILCSFGGKISDGPSAGNLMYIGATTRVIRIGDDISWQQLREKTTANLQAASYHQVPTPGRGSRRSGIRLLRRRPPAYDGVRRCWGSTGLEKLFSMFLFAGDSTDPQAQQSDASRASAEGKVASGSSTSDYDPPPRSPPGKSELSHAALASADDRDALQVEKPIVKVEENLGAAASENEQESDSTDLIALIDCLGCTCSRLRSIHIASIRLCHEAVLALAGANLRS